MDPTTQAKVIQEVSRWAGVGLKVLIARPAKRAEPPRETCVTGKKGEKSLGQPVNALEPTTGLPEFPPGPSIAVSEAETLNYQLDLLLDDLAHLETEHLPQRGRINGKACDCIAKAGRSLRRHALETIPIAGRQGIDASIFSDLADRADRLITIGTAQAVTIGEHDGEYLSAAGELSLLRKSLETLKSKVVASCEGCAIVKPVKQWLRDRQGSNIPPGELETP